MEANAYDDSRATARVIKAVYHRYSQSREDGRESSTKLLVKLVALPQTIEIVVLKLKHKFKNGRTGNIARTPTLCKSL